MMSKEKQIEIPEDEKGVSGYTKLAWKLYDKVKLPMVQCEVIDRIVREEGYRKQSEWISVEERLPETEGDYLVWNKEQKRIEIRFFHRLPPHYPVESHPEIREYFGNFADYKIITHWMPLPDAPKGGE